MLPPRKILCVGDPLWSHMDFPVDLENAVTSIEERLDMTAGNTKVLESGDIGKPLPLGRVGRVPVFSYAQLSPVGLLSS